MGVLLLFAIVWGALQVPQVQTAVVEKVTQSLSKKLNTTLSIQRVDIDFFKTIVLEGIYVEDQKKDTLLYAQELKVNLGVLSLMKKTINVNLIGLDNAVVNLTRAKGDTAFNFAFIPEAFASKDTTAKDTTASAWDFDLSEVDLKQVRFNLADAQQGNDLNMAVKSFVVDVKTLGLADKYPQINDITIDGLNLAFSQPKPEADTLAATVAATTQLDTLASSAAKAVEEETSQQASVPSKDADSVKTAFNSSGYRLAINDINIKSTAIKYDVKGAPTVKKGMDFNHVDIQKLLLEITGIEIGVNTFALNVDNFAFQEKSGFDLQALALEFEADMPSVQVNVKKLKTANSVLDDGVQVKIASINDAANLIKNIEIYSNFNQDSLAVKDAQYFTVALDSMPALQGQHLFLDGKLHIDGQNADAKQLKVAIDKDNYLILEGRAEKIYNLADMRVNAHIMPLKTSSSFIQKFLPKGTMPAQFNQLGNITLQATLDGYLRDMKGKIDLESAAGEINLNFTGATDTTFIHNRANANLTLKQVDLEKLLGKASKLGKVNLTAQINGSQSGKNIAVQHAKVNVKSLRYNQYTYRNINLTGNYLNDIVKATLEADDKNLQASIRAAANMQTKQPVFDLNADIREVNLQELNLTTDTLTIRSGIIANVKGTVPDEMTGDIILSNIFVQQPTRTITMDSVVVGLDKQGNTRKISVRSDVLQAKAEGEFTFAELPIAINLFIKEYLTNYQVSDARLTSNQSVNFEMAIAPNPEIIESMVTGLDIPQAINFKGSFSSADNQLKLDGIIPQLNFGVQGVTDFRLDVNTNGEKLSFGAQAAQVKASDSLIIPLPRIATSIDKDNLQFNIRLAADEADSRLNLNGRFRIKQDTFIVDFDPSDIYFKKDHWQLADNGKVVYAPKYVFVDGFMLRQDNQVIAVNSRDIGTSTPALLVSLANINIAEILELVGQQKLGLSGLIYGETQVSNLFEAPTIEALVQVDTLKANGSAIGHITLEADRNAEGGIGMQASINSQANDINATGSYFPAKETDNLSADVIIKRIALEQFQTFVSKHVTEMKGDLTANLKVRGSTSDPAVTGELVFGKTMIRPTLLGVPFTITDQRISFRDKAVALSNFTFADEDKRTAILDGLLDYKDMENISMNMTFKTDRFQFLNTRTGESFYGKAFASANIRMQGPVSNLVMTGRVKTLEDTKVFLITYDKGGAEVARAKYITFVSPNASPSENDADDVDEKKANAGPSGFSMNLRASVTSDAEVNILISDASKDNIRALGDGDFDIRMTPQGDMLINGVYTISEGSYLLDLLGAVKKKFDIRKGSTITMNGPPTEAELALIAEYKVETSLEEIGIQTNTKRVPVLAVTKINGNLKGLDIKFDIEVPNTGNSTASQQLEEALTRIRANESELNKQVFALIALNKFLSEESGVFGGSGGSTTETVNSQVDQTISGVLSQQLNNLAQDYLGVEVSVDVESQEGTSSYTDKNVGLNVSKQLFNDRLSVSLGGNVGVGGSAASANSSKNIVGDFTVEYRLLPSGNLNLRFFRRNESNILSTSSTRMQERIGFSLAHRRNFNQWKYLFKSRTRERQQQRTPPATQL